MDAITCDCGAKIRKIQAKGRTFRFGEYGAIQLKKSLKLLSCPACGQTYLEGNERALDKALNDSLADNTAEILSYIKASFNLKENQIAKFCGLTAETLSRCKNADSGKVISAHAFKLLTGLANLGPAFKEAVALDSWRNQGEFGNGKFLQNPESLEIY